MATIINKFPGGYENLIKGLENGYNSTANGLQNSWVSIAPGVESGNNTTTARLSNSYHAVTTTLGNGIRTYARLEPKTLGLILSVQSTLYYTRKAYNHKGDLSERLTFTALAAFSFTITGYSLYHRIMG